MNYNQVNDACLFNTLYIQHVEDVGENEYFYYDLKYPAFYNVKNGYFQANENILKNLNTTINSSVHAFKQGLLEEEEQINSNNTNGTNSKVNYRVLSDYNITFNKNQIISLILKIMALDNNNLQYNDLYNYNIDLLTGNQLLLRDIFKPDVDYLKLVSDFVNSKITENPDFYYPDTVVDIPVDQSFYLTDQGIVIYFDLDEVAPSAKGIPKFLMEFPNFDSYINPRFYCNKNRTNYNMRNRKPPYNRIYF